MSAPRGALAALARHAGILPGFVDQQGHERRTPAAAMRCLLTHLGWPAATARQAQATWREVQAAPAPLPPTWVTAAPRPLWQHPAPPGAHTFRLVIDREDGERHVLEGRVRDGHVRARLPAAMPHGYHHLVACVGGQTLAQHCITTPPACVAHARRLGPGQTVGLWANLYALHSRASLGVGDLHDLAALTQWAGAQGLHFVGINPLHALRNVRGDISPYSPVSRLYRNPLYLHVEAIPELADAPRARALLHAAAASRDQWRLGSHVDYDAVWRTKVAIFTALHDTFGRLHERRDTARGAAYRAFCAAQGQTLRDFAVFCAIDAHFAARGRHGSAQWPAAYRTRDQPAVERFAREHPRAVALHCYLQFELDRQLQEVARSARESGMRLGLYQDLAIGSAADGAEPWCHPQSFVSGLSVGAPPDDYAAQGQDWGVPPLHPQRLGDDGYALWRRLLRGCMAHGGALRVDHVMGLFRLFVLPRGGPARLGAYLRYPAADLLHILALESHRHDALVIGEDLGTVPRGLPEVLRRCNILSSRVLLFERQTTGAFRAAAHYSDHALVTATTHDHVPLAGYVAGHDAALRLQLAGRRSAGAQQAVLRRRGRDVRQLIGRLRQDGALPAASVPLALTPTLLVAAVHRFLRATPAPLLGLSLDDLFGETEPVNLPGVAPTAYPCWSRRSRLSLEALSSLAVRRRLGEPDD